MDAGHRELVSQISSRVQHRARRHVIGLSERIAAVFGGIDATSHPERRASLIARHGSELALDLLKHRRILEEQDFTHQPRRAPRIGRSLGFAITGFQVIAKPIFSTPRVHLC